MPTITYDEFRPGHWVKKVDGKVVGPATAAEVAAWKQEKAAPARIWEDVVATASRPPSGETKVAKPLAVKAGPAAPPSTPKEPDQSTVWEDLVKRSQHPVQPEGPPEPRPRREDMDQAEQAQIWRDVVKRAMKPGPQPERQPAQEAPISPPSVPEARRRPATKGSSPPTSAPTRAVPPILGPSDEGSNTMKAFAAEVVSPKLPDTALTSTVTAKPEAKAALVGKAAARTPAPKPALPAKLTAKAEIKPAREAAPALKALPAETPPGPKAGAVKATPQRPTAKATEKAKTVTKAVLARKTTVRSELSRATRTRLPAKLLDEIAEQESPPATEPGKVAATPEAKRRGAPPLEQESVSTKRRSRKPAVARRTAAKDKTITPPERPNQLYLWISAGQTDDLVAAVRTGLARYQERFGHVAEVVLCHSSDLATLEGAKLAVDLREGKSLAPRNFWIGSK